MRSSLPLPFRTSMSFLLILVVLFMSACSERSDESQTAPANTGQNATPSAGASKGWLFLLLGAAAGVGGVMAWRKWATPFFNPQQESAPRKRQEPSLQHDEYKKMQLQLEKYKEDNLQLESKNRRLEQEKRELAQQNKSLFRENIGLGDEIETLKAKNEHEVQEDFPEDDQPAISSPHPPLLLSPFPTPLHPLPSSMPPPSSTTP